MRHLPGLDLLRAFAIAWVMLFHSWIVGGIGDPFRGVATTGWMGVDLFFVLSGYLIGYQVLLPLHRTQRFDFGDFYLRRALRILPAFMVVLAIYVLFPTWRELPGLAPTWQFVSFSMNLLIDYRHQPAFSHAWSLCVEEHFYSLFPALAWWLSRQRKRWLTTIIISLIMFGGMLLRSWLWTRHDGLGEGNDFLELIYFPSWSRLDGPLVGVLIAWLQVWAPQSWRAWQRHNAILLCAGLFLSGIMIALLQNRMSYFACVLGFPLLALALGLLVMAAADPASLLNRHVVPGSGWIARTSYSLYLSHKLVMHAVQQALLVMPPLPGAVRFAFYAIAIGLVGACLYQAVERPLLRLRRHWLDANREISQPATS